MEENWRMKLLKDRLKILEETSDKMTVTRDEKRDVMLKIRYFNWGVEFANQDVNEGEK